jgi:hypothetical protein
MAMGLVVTLIAALLGNPGFAAIAMFPAAMLMVSMFFTSLYFTFEGSFVEDAEPSGGHIHSVDINA